MSLRRTALTATLSVATLALAACGGGSEDGRRRSRPSPRRPSSRPGRRWPSSPRPARSRVGTKFDQPGFGLENLEGEVEGFDVEVAKIIAGALGIAPEDIEFVGGHVGRPRGGASRATRSTWSSRRTRSTTSARSGSPSPGPYYEAGQQIMVAADDDTITGPESFTENPDAMVCSVTGSTPSENIREYLASDDQLVLFEEYSQCADALENGQVDAVTTDNVILLGFVAESDGAFKLVGEQFTEEPYGIGITKGDVEFCEFINETLADNEEAYVGGVGGHRRPGRGHRDARAADRRRVRLTL